MRALARVLRSDRRGSQGQMCGTLCGALGGCGRNFPACRVIPVIFLITVISVLLTAPGDPSSRHGAITCPFSAPLAVRVLSSDNRRYRRSQGYQIFRLGMIQLSENRTDLGSK